MRNSSLQNQAENMRAKRWSNLRYLPHLVVYLGILNFILFFLSTLLVGGNALNGTVEAGRYFLGDHGYYVEVIYPVYLLNRLWSILTVVTWPLVIMAGVAAWGVDHNGPDNAPLRVVNLGNAFNLVEGFVSFAFDSWRKPDLEFFTRLTEPNCVTDLITMPPTVIDDNLQGKKLLDVTSGGHHFELGRRSWSLYDTGGTWMSFTVLHGRFQSTPHGTYVKAWYRFSTFPLLFLSIFAMGILAFPVFGLEWLVAKVIGTDPWIVAGFFTPIWPIWSRLSLVIGALLLVAFSGWWGRHSNRDLAHLVKNVLKQP